MSGIHQMLLGGANPGANINAAFVAVVTNLAASGVLNGSLTWVNNGTTTRAPGGAGQNWFIPTVAGIGSNWSIRTTVTSQLNTSFGGNAAPGVTWTPLSAGCTCSMQNTASNLQASGSINIAFSPNGGATIYPGGTLTWNVGATS